MDTTENHEREIRAARNQSLFRALNEKIREVNLEFSVTTENLVIACECADVTCVEMIDISSDEYASVRRHPRHFAVLEGHVYPEVEKVVALNHTHVVVEKLAHAGAIAEATSELASSHDDSAGRPASA